MCHTPWTWEPRGRLELPDDLRRWISEETLVRLVFEAVHLAQSPLPPGRPRVCLTTLTYSYAIGLYDAQEIEDRIPTDPQLLYLSAKIPLSGNDLRQFRRYHRPWLQRTLGLLLQLACEARFRTGINSTLVCLPGEMAALCAEAAEHRIEEAVLRDTMALDT